MNQQALLNTQIAADTLDLCESLFGIKYPLNKLDLVSCHQLANRAMENWGCITVKRNLLLYNSDVDTDELFQRNLIYSERMARWCTCLSQISVQVAVPEPDQLQSIFDTISYAKGSAICRMLYAYIGDDTLFFKCLKAYMEKFAYVYIGICSQRSIRSHTIYQCFPRVKLERTSPTTYTLTQSLQDTDNLWPIPIFYLTIPQGLESFTLLTQQSQTLEIPPETEALCLNSNCTGFFITDYDDTTLHTLIVNNQLLSQAGRYSLLHDILFMRGSLEIEWLPYFKGETSISVWQTWYEQIKKIEVTEEVKRLQYMPKYISFDIIRDQDVTDIVLEYLRGLIVEREVQMIRIPPDLRISIFKIGQKNPEINEALLEAVKNPAQKWY